MQRVAVRVGVLVRLDGAREEAARETIYPAFSSRTQRVRSRTRSFSMMLSAPEATAVGAMNAARQQRSRPGPFSRAEYKEISGAAIS